MYELFIGVSCKPVRYHFFPPSEKRSRIFEWMGEFKPEEIALFRGLLSWGLPLTDKQK
jgi:hypothetical protein